MYRKKNYTDILYDNEEEKKEFFDTLIQKLKDKKGENGRNFSHQDYAERFVKSVLIAFWTTVLDEIIYNNREIPLFGDDYVLSISKYEFPGKYKVVMRGYSGLLYRPFIKRREPCKKKVPRLKLRTKYRKILISEIEHGHEYKRFKPF